MWTLMIKRADLIERQACSSGLQVFDEIAPSGELTLPPPGQEWTQEHWRLADVWLRTQSYYSWLIGSDLWRPANLDGAYLARAYLARANLARANLAGANLAGANLAGANLARAYLARAYLARAYLARANLDGAYLAGANLAGAYLAGAYLAGANLKWWERGPDGRARRKEGAPPRCGC